MRNLLELGEFNVIKNRNMTIWRDCLFVAALAFLIFLPWARGYFVGDDWMLLARNSGKTLPEQLRQISDASNSRWYRPLSELTLVWTWRLFGLNPVGHHIVNFSLYALNAVLVTVLGRCLAQDRRVGLLSGLIFATHCCHAEPVVWVTARHEMLAATMALFSLLLYMRFRESQRWSLWWGSLLLYFLGLGFKETVLALPLFLAFYDFIFTFPSLSCKQRKLNVQGLGPNPDEPELNRAYLHGKSLLKIQEFTRLGLTRLGLTRLGLTRLGLTRLGPILPASLGGLVYLIYRLIVGGGYEIPFNLISVFKNLCYYLLMEIVALPVSTHFLTRFSLWTWPIIIALTLACFCSVWLAKKQILGSHVIWFGAGWMIFALAPVILIVTERTTYFSSVGWAWTMATVLVLAWDTHGISLPVLKRKLVILSALVILGANLITLNHRSYWWNRAGAIFYDVLSQVRDSLELAPPVEDMQLWFFNFPYRIEYAYAFGNRILFAVWLSQMDVAYSHPLDFKTEGQISIFEDVEIDIPPHTHFDQLLSMRAVNTPVVAFYWQGGDVFRISNIPEDGGPDG